MNEDLREQMETEPIPAPRSYKKNPLWRITKFIVLGISLFVYAFFILRLCTSSDPQSVTRVQWNDVAEAAYQSDPEGFEILEQKPDAFITDDGRFWISNVLYLPAAKQMQVTIKFNNSTIKYLPGELAKAMNEAAVKRGEIKKGETLYTPEDFEIPEEAFDYSLIDDNGKRYHPTSISSEKKQNYNYRVLVFDNIDIEEAYTVYADMYYVEALDYEKAPYGSLRAWHNELPAETRDVENER